MAGEQRVMLGGLPIRAEPDGEGAYRLGVSSESGGGGGASTIADAADVNAGALADAAATAGGTGSISAKLRAISRDIVANIVLKAGTAIIGKVGIDQTTPGTTNGVVATASEAHIGQVGGHIAPIRVEKTRAADATAYAVNDIINESLSAGTPWTVAVARAGGPGSGVVCGFLLQHNVNTVVAQCEIDVYDAAPAVALNDNVESTHLYADAGKLLRTVQLPALAKKTTNSDMVEAYVDCAVPFDAVDGTNIYLRLRTLTAFTPGSGSKFLITTFASQD